ncbi:hypothetical protein [Sphingomonas dokdonensis]|uniref:Homeodomain phBC6A51-type domain-containing protein n=1 Tax=Sphingomonas dokdonensis TaxID=344880 RepID=A0A245ZDL9_9SPHN|nr:hypothetical protein [Sphingomonas dokdonensis]OWK27762.1 hypothetical protein SPDO_31260 [Sphingomonas dokdonensis]
MAIGMAEGIVRLGGTGARGSVTGAAAQRRACGGDGVGKGARRGDAGGSGETVTAAPRGRSAAGRPRAARDPAVGDACASGAMEDARARREDGAPRGRRIAGGAKRPRQTRVAFGSIDGAGAAALGDEAGAALGGVVGRDEPLRGTERIAGHTTRLRQLRFAKVLAETCNVAAAAAAAGRTLATVHRWRSVDAAFAAAWDEALAIGYDRLENALLVYAIGKVDGVAAGAAGASISNGDLQLAVGMLQRHRAATSGRRGQTLPVRMPTEAESDAALKRALDGLARRGAPS